jgi:PAS domain S-box-containing protein
MSTHQLIESDTYTMQRLTLPISHRRAGIADDNEERLRAMLDVSQDGILVLGRDAKITEINAAGAEMLGLAASELTGKGLGAFVSSEQAEPYAACLDALGRGEKGCMEFETIGNGDTRRWLELHATPMRDAGEQICGYLAMLRDNTARRELAKQFVQAQKMEVVGHLAGGVAHDFNNMLGIILGYTDILMQDMAPGSEQFKNAEAVFHTGERAAALTKQLLIFSRKEAPRPRVVDLSEVIVRIDPMLRRLLGENISLVTEPEPEMFRVQTDPSHIEQVLMNLTVNARDAMPDGGVITVQTGNATIRSNDPGHPGIAPGRYGVFSVTDTGTGMSDEVKGKIFDAFFTTKPAGRGTGLGLATCQTIVKQWGGNLEVESKVGAGSTFRIYLPCMASPVAGEKNGEQARTPRRGVEMVLLVEDEPGLLAMTSIVLGRQGYKVLKATNGTEALGIVNNEGKNIDLVVTDMVMPEMGGKLLADWLRAIRPDIQVLFTSGYTDCELGGAVDASLEFIPKPYTPAGLLSKVRSVLDRAWNEKETQSHGAEAA